MSGSTQEEPRNERASLAITASEKEALRLVSLLDRISESNLLRDMTIDQIVARAHQIREQTKVA